jgi:hypothetical protein
MTTSDLGSFLLDHEFIAFLEKCTVRGKRGDHAQLPRQQSVFCGAIIE